MTVEETIQDLIRRFTRKMTEDKEMRAEIKPLVKTFNLDLTTEQYSFRLENAEISDYRKELLEGADVTITTTPKYFQALVDGDLRPMRAYVMKKIAVKGKIKDLMFLKKFF